MSFIFTTQNQAFIQALLSTVDSPQRFSFFTVCLVQCFCWGVPTVGTEGEILEI